MVNKNTNFREIMAVELEIQLLKKVVDICKTKTQN